jgi:hypothetical protein
LRRLRLESPGPPRAAAPSSLSSYKLGEFISRDVSAMGFDRSSLLSELSARPNSRLLSNRSAVALVRDGRKARHIGPLFADRADRALELVAAIVRSETSPVLIDAVNSHQEFLNGLTGSGWTIERPFQRMRFGGAMTLPAEPPFVVAGPEFG